MKTWLERNLFFFPFISVLKVSLLFFLSGFPPTSPLCYTPYICAFDELSCQLFLWTVCENKSTEKIISHPPQVLKSGKENKFNSCKWQPQIIDTIKPGIWEWIVNQNSTVCNPTDKEEEWSEFFSSIYLSALSKRLWLWRIRAPRNASSHCQARLDVNTLFHTLGITLPVWSPRQNLPSTGKAVMDGHTFSTMVRKIIRPPNGSKSQSIGWQMFLTGKGSKLPHRSTMRSCMALFIPRQWWCHLKFIKSFLFWRRQKVGKPQTALWVLLTWG